MGTPASAPLRNDPHRNTHWFRVLIAGLLITMSGEPALAQFGQSDPIGDTATAVEVYEASVDSCYYKPVVGQALAKLSQYYSRTQPYRWERAKREAVDAHVMAGNFGEMMNKLLVPNMDMGGYGPGTQRLPAPEQPKTSRCRTYGLMIAQALPGALMQVGMDSGLMDETNRLIGGGGRDLTLAPPSGAPQAAGKSGWHKQGQTIAFGVAETDDRKIVFDCRSHKLLVRGPLAAQAEAGKPVSVTLSGLGVYQTIKGSVVEAGDGLNFEAAVPPTSVPVATVLAEQPLVVEVPEGSSIVPAGGATLMREILASCLVGRG